MLDPLRPQTDLNTNSVAIKGPVAQWIEHRPPEPGVARSNRARVIEFHAGSLDSRRLSNGAS